MSSLNLMTPCIPGLIFCVVIASFALFINTKYRKNSKKRAGKSKDNQEETQSSTACEIDCKDVVHEKQNETDDGTIKSKDIVSDENFKLERQKEIKRDREIAKQIRAKEKEIAKKEREQQKAAAQQDREKAKQERELEKKEAKIQREKRREEAKLERENERQESQQKRRQMRFSHASSSCLNLEESSLNKEMVHGREKINRKTILLRDSTT